MKKRLKIPTQKELASLSSEDLSDRINNLLKNLVEDIQQNRSTTQTVRSYRAYQAEQYKRNRTF